MQQTSKTTANERIADPGGTHPTRGQAHQPGKTEQHVETGDRNVRPDPETKPDT